MSAVRALKGIAAHGKKETFTPGIEIEKNLVFRFWDCFMELIVNLPVSGIKPIVPGHLEILFRDMLNEQFNEIHGRKSSLNEGVVFMLVVMESHQFAIIGINPGKSNDRASKITADISHNGIGIAEIGLGVNIEAIFVLMVNERFSLFKGGADAFFQFI